MSPAEAPQAVVDLADRASALVEAARSAAHGRASEAVVHGDHQRAVLIALTAGAELGEHDSPPAATFQVLTGTVELYAGALSWRVGPSQLVPIPHGRHGVRAMTDCAVLLTVALG